MCNNHGASTWSTCDKSSTSIYCQFLVFIIFGEAKCFPFLSLIFLFISWGFLFVLFYLGSLFWYYLIMFQDGLVRVLLDGGPSRIFSQSDAKLFEEDLDILKVESASRLLTGNRTIVWFTWNMAISSDLFVIKSELKLSKIWNDLLWEYLLVRGMF